MNFTSLQSTFVADEFITCLQFAAPSQVTDPSTRNNGGTADFRPKASGAPAPVMQTDARPELRVERALLKLELPDWFRLYYKPKPIIDKSKQFDAFSWTKLRSSVRIPRRASPLPNDKRNLIIPKRVTFRPTCYDVTGLGSRPRPWQSRSMRTPYLGWRPGPGERL